MCIVNDPFANNATTGSPDLLSDPFNQPAVAQQVATDAEHGAPALDADRQPSQALAEIEAAEQWAQQAQDPRVAPSQTTMGSPPAVPTAPSAAQLEQMQMHTARTQMRRASAPEETVPTVSDLPAIPAPPQQHVAPPEPAPPAPPQQHAAPPEPAPIVAPALPAPGPTSVEPTHRFYSPTSFLLLQSAMLLAGLAVGLTAGLDGEILPAAIGGFMFCFAVFSFGWVDIEPGVVSQEKIGRKTVTAEHEVASIELDFDKSRHTKWWYPVLVRIDGQRVELKTLRSVSKTKTEQKARIIQAALNNEDIFVTPQERASGAAGPGAPQPEHEMFTPLPGLEHHYNR